MEYTGWDEYRFKKATVTKPDHSGYIKEPQSFIIADVNDVKALEKRVDRIDVIYTERIHEIEKRIKDLEDPNKDLPYDVWIHGRIKDLEEKYYVLDGVDRDSHKRLVGLEEWKDNCMAGHPFGPQRKNEPVVIDKKIWEEIKYRVRLVRSSLRNESPTLSTDIDLQYLFDAIKKVDPGWAP